MEYKREIGTALLVIMFFVPPLVMYMTADRIVIKGMIVSMDNDGSIYIKGNIEGMGFTKNIENRRFIFVFRVLSMDGETYETPFVIP